MYLLKPYIYCLELSLLQLLRAENDNIFLPRLFLRVKFNSEMFEFDFDFI